VSSPAFDISIIVATFNRCHSLARLLESLDYLDYADSVTLEVLIVDNGSTDQTRSLLVQKQQQPLKYCLKILCEERRGKSAALNRGLRNCCGQIICLADDDMVFDSHWIGGLLQSYKASDFAALQGRVLPGIDGDGNGADLKRIREYNIPIVDYGNKIRDIDGLTGTNMSFKREVYDRVGFFDSRLGPGASGFSEDTEYSMRVRKAGFKIGYTPHAVAYHELSPQRYGREYHRRVQYRKGISRSIYRDDSVPFRVIPDLVVNCLRYGLYCVSGKTQKAYKTEGRIMKCWGYLMGKARRLNFPDTYSQP
jgi:glucosyl-dolichyl phosphate glucuronosyltransferase